MAENAMIITLCLFLMVSQSLTQTPFPSPANNPCTLYDLNTGYHIPVFSFELFIQETDFLNDPTLSVIVPVSGRGISVLSAPDGDVDSIAKLTDYAIIFEYDSNTGYNYMRVFNPINRDGLSVENNDDLNFLQFNIRCTFGYAEQFFTVTVWIEDANDNAPVFQNLPYFKEIKEALPVQNTVYGLISATDLDENKQVEYKIISGNTFNGQTYFNMPNDAKGYIMLQRSLDFEELDQAGATRFIIILTANDKGLTGERKTSTATLTIDVQDSDDLTPTFSHSGCLSSGSVAFSCDAVRYRSVVTSGVVDINTPLEFIPVVGGSETSINDIVAFDMDKLSAAIEYIILPQSQPAGFSSRFSVATSVPFSVPDRAIYRATIRQTQPISRTEATRFSLYIVARQTDDINKFKTAELQFNVQPNNENDPRVRTSTGVNTGYIVENAVAGTQVRGAPAGQSAIILIVSDPDVVGEETQNYTYSITSAAPFAVEPISSDRASVYATQPLDAECQGSYNFNVLVTEDNASPRSTSITLTVIVQDDNDNTPTFNANNYNAVVLEGDYSDPSTFTLIDQIRATDRDSGRNGDITYSIESADLLSSTLTPAQVLDIVRLQSPTLPNVILHGLVTSDLAFVVTIKAIDGGEIEPRASTVTLSVQVLSFGQNAPVFVADNYFVQISEAAVSGAYVLRVRATDVDQDDALLTYNILTPYVEGSNRFVIRTSGVIQLGGTPPAQPLDYESEQRYVFLVTATDSTSNIATATVTVEVTNVNKNQPQFNRPSYTFSVLEGQSSTLLDTVGAIIDIPTAMVSGEDGGCESGIGDAKKVDFETVDMKDTSENAIPSPSDYHEDILNIERKKLLLKKEQIVILRQQSEYLRIISTSLERNSCE